MPCLPLQRVGWRVVWPWWLLVAEPNGSAAAPCGVLGGLRHLCVAAVRRTRLLWLWKLTSSVSRLVDWSATLLSAF